MVNARNIPAYFMILFLSLSFLSALGAVYQGWKKTDHNSIAQTLKGKWASLYEKNFNDAYLLFTPSRTGWGIAEYLLFREGRDGTLIGADGWLFSTEEFAAEPDRDALVSGHMAYIEQVAETLKARGIPLVVALVPAKARIYEEKLGKYEYPAYNRDFYVTVRDRLAGQGMVVPDLAATLDATPDAFIRTDTHWTPAGARAVAQALAGAAQEGGLSWRDSGAEAAFINKPQDKPAAHDGDLLRYVQLGPLKEKLGFAPEKLDAYTTEQTGDSPEADLFGDSVPPVTLVGTSYSANPLWNFEGFLKESLKSDVLNVADEGKGPFATMKAYLDSNPYRETPPRMVVWEIPERYIALEEKLPEKEK